MKKPYAIASKAVMLFTIAVLLLTSCSGLAPSKESSAPETAPAPSAAASDTPGLPPAVPVEWQDGGIFLVSYERAYQLLGRMTLEEKVGQLLLVRCPQKDAESFIKAYHPGGLVLFEVDFKDKTESEVISTIQAYQSASAIPLIISVDEEGGKVVRISGNPKLSEIKFRSPRDIYDSGGLNAVREDTLKKAALLKKLGVNLNLAPVADVSTDPGDYIYPRALGLPAEETGKYAATVVQAMQERQMSSALKHFPGYGNNTDTHKGMAIDNRPYSTFLQSDFIPFERGIAAGAESILVSHTIVNCMEAGVPASLSKKAHVVLRKTLKFTGIIMTDELSMDAVKEYTEDTNPAVRAVLAGNDMLMLKDYDGAFRSVLTAVNSGDIALNVIDRTVFRILAWKLTRGIIR